MGEEKLLKPFPNILNKLTLLISMSTMIVSSSLIENGLIYKDVLSLSSSFTSRLEHNEISSQSGKGSLYLNRTMCRVSFCLFVIHASDKSIFLMGFIFKTFIFKIIKAGIEQISDISL